MNIVSYCLLSISRDRLSTSFVAGWRRLQTFGQRLCPQSRHHVERHPLHQWGQRIPQRNHQRCPMVHGHRYILLISLYAVITAWYVIDVGGMQDYNYIYHGTMEITLEVSCCKHPPGSALKQHWADNRRVRLLTWFNPLWFISIDCIIPFLK